MPPSISIKPLPLVLRCCGSAQQSAAGHPDRRHPCLSVVFLFPDRPSRWSQDRQQGPDLAQVDARFLCDTLLHGGTVVTNTCPNMPSPSGAILMYGPAASPRFSAEPSCFDSGHCSACGAVLRPGIACHPGQDGRNMLTAGSLVFIYAELTGYIARSTDRWHCSAILINPYDKLLVIFSKYA